MLKQTSDPQLRWKLLPLKIRGSLQSVILSISVITKVLLCCAAAVPCGVIETALVGVGVTILTFFQDLPKNDIRFINLIIFNISSTVVLNLDNHVSESPSCTRCCSVLLTGWDRCLGWHGLVWSRD